MNKKRIRFKINIIFTNEYRVILQLYIHNHIQCRTSESKWHYLINEYNNTECAIA